MLLRIACLKIFLNYIYEKFDCYMYAQFCWYFHLLLNSWNEAYGVILHYTGIIHKLYSILFYYDKLM